VLSALIALSDRQRNVTVEGVRWVLPARGLPAARRPHKKRAFQENAFLGFAFALAAKWPP